ncbi:MAG: sn-glycerol-3-phosphate ABC transporter ATP-binding protein UgpC [Planctomycetes bacterium]|nr:sn-glycerol-3-phosphate ABC transporter ATP-binding protein UgpC [Planctomycetota bacterium]
MADVTFTNVHKVYDGKIKAVSDFNLKVSHGEFVVLVGPSGCGKSTSLRMVAGLEEITSGTIAIGDRVVNEVPPKDRDIAMVFQNYALYPHMTVFDNMAFGLKLRGFAKAEIRRRVQEAAEILGIRDLLERRPKALSGGQRQRVAVGRAIVRKPAVFLFDEPLSNLDAKLRVQMRVEINRLHKRLGTTMIYVTHDQIEAMTMGDRIVVMKDGWVQQVDSPLGLYDRPANMFVAGFIGTPPMNFFHGQVVQAAGGGPSFEEGSFTLELPKEWSAKVGPYLGKAVVLGLRPEDVGSAAAEQAANAPKIRATVEMTESMGSESYVHLNTGKHTFVSRMDAHRGLQRGQQAELTVLLHKTHLYDPATEKLII